jgi:hypothetical protein
MIWVRRFSWTGSLVMVIADLLDEMLRRSGTMG